MRRPITRLLVLPTLVLGVLAASCTTPSTSAATDFTFRATKVTATAQTEHSVVQSCTYILSNCYDEPYLVNIWFRVTYDLPDSASADVVSTRATSPEVTVCKASLQPPCATGSQTESLGAGAGKNGGQVTFKNVKRPSLIDLTNPDNKIEIVGNWTWALEEDWIGNPVPQVIAPVIEQVLNDTIALAETPESGDIAQDTVDQFEAAVTSQLAEVLSDALSTIGDDLLGSRLYLFVGSSGALATTIDLASVNYSDLNLALQNLGIPDVDEVLVKSTNPQSFAGQSFAGAGATHTYDFVTG